MALIQRFNLSWLISLAVFQIGLAITFVVYQSKLESEQEQSQAFFQKEASLRAQDIEAEFNRSFFQVASVGNLFASSDWVSNAEFLSFVRRVFPDFPEGRRLTIVSHFDQSLKDTFIQQVRSKPFYLWTDYS